MATMVKPKLFLHSIDPCTHQLTVDVHGNLVNFSDLREYIEAYGRETIKPTNIDACITWEAEDTIKIKGNLTHDFIEYIKAYGKEKTMASAEIPKYKVDGEIFLSPELIDAIEKALEERHRKSDDKLDDLGTVYEVMEKISNIEGFIQNFRKDITITETPYALLRRIRSEINK